jgi:hypothetical protein
LTESAPDVHTCEVNVSSFGGCTPQEPAEKGLFDNRYVPFTLFYSQAFDVVSLKARSAELALTIEGKPGAAEVVLLTEPEVILKGIGFKLTSFMKRP